MAKNAVTDYSTTAASNTDVGGVGIQGTNAISNADDAFREIMSHLAETNAGTSPWADTMTIGDAADLTKEFRFEASGITAGQTRVLTVPDANVTVGNRPVSDDNAALGASGVGWSDLFLASGGVINWNAADVTITHSSNALAFAGASSGYSFDAPIVVTGSNLIPAQFTSTDAGASGGPNLSLTRDSASPAANDDIGAIVFYGKDSGNNTTLYGAFAAKINDPTDGSEDSQFNFLTVVAGAATIPMSLAAGVTVGTAYDPGAGHIAVQYGIATGAPVTKTGTSSTIASTETSVIFNASGTHTVTLPAASSFSGRWLFLKTRAANAVNSASSNVKPLGTDTAGTAILTANAGRWANLQSDGTNWVIMAGVV